MDLHDNADMQDGLGAFEAAMHAKVTIPTPAPLVVLLALDGSDQDATGRAMAAHVVGRTGARLIEISDAPSGRDVALRAKEEKADLVVIDAPFREDFAKDAHGSLGSGIDILLAEVKVPVLLVRAPQEHPENCFEDVLVAISVYDDRAAVAAGWALALVGERGRIEVLDIPDATVIQEARKLLGDGDEAAALRSEAISRVAQRDAGGLVGALQKRASQEKLQVHFEVKIGHPVKLVAEAANARPRLVVVPGDPQSDTPGHYRVHAIALLSESPILII